MSMLLALGIGMFLWVIATFVPAAIFKNKTFVQIDWLGVVFWACLVIVLLAADGIAELRTDSAYTSIFKTIVIIAGCAFGLTSILKRVDKALDGNSSLTIKKGDASISVAGKNPSNSKKRSNSKKKIIKKNENVDKKEN
jgi:hypothetical protein